MKLCGALFLCVVVIIPKSDQNVVKGRNNGGFSGSFSSSSSASSSSSSSSSSSFQFTGASNGDANLNEISSTLKELVGNSGALAGGAAVSGGLGGQTSSNKIPFKSDADRYNVKEDSEDVAGSASALGKADVSTKAPCCKGPFPGPDGSINDSTPAPSQSNAQAFPQGTGTNAGGSLNGNTGTSVNGCGIGDRNCGTGGNSGSSPQGSAGGSFGIGGAVSSGAGPNSGNSCGLGNQNCGGGFEDSNNQNQGQGNSETLLGGSPIPVPSQPSTVNIAPQAPFVGPVDNGTPCNPGDTNCVSLAIPNSDTLLGGSPIPIPSQGSSGGFQANVQISGSNPCSSGQCGTGDAQNSPRNPSQGVPSPCDVGNTNCQNSNFETSSQNTIAGSGSNTGIYIGGGLQEGSRGPPSGVFPETGLQEGPRGTENVDQGPRDVPNVGLQEGPQGAPNVGLQEKPVETEPSGVKGGSYHHHNGGVYTGLIYGGKVPTLSEIDNGPQRGGNGNQGTVYDNKPSVPTPQVPGRVGSTDYKPVAPIPQGNVYGKRPLGPFPGPNGSIHDSKPANSVPPPPSPHGIPPPYVAPSYGNSGINTAGSGAVGNSGKVPCCKGPFPGPNGSIHDFKPVNSVQPPLMHTPTNLNVVPLPSPPRIPSYSNTGSVSGSGTIPSQQGSFPGSSSSFPKPNLPGSGSATYHVDTKPSIAQPALELNPPHDSGYAHHPQEHKPQHGGSYAGSTGSGFGFGTSFSNTPVQTGKVPETDSTGRVPDSGSVSNIGSNPSDGGFGVGGSFSGSQNTPSNSGSGDSFTSNPLPGEGDVSQTPRPEGAVGGRPEIGSQPSGGNFGFGGGFSGSQNRPSSSGSAFGGSFSSNPASSDGEVPQTARPEGAVGGRPEIGSQPSGGNLGFGGEISGSQNRPSSSSSDFGGSFANNPVSPGEIPRRPESQGTVGGGSASNIGAQPGGGGFGFGGSFSGSQNRPSSSGSAFGGSFSGSQNRPSNSGSAFGGSNPVSTDGEGSRTPESQGTVGGGPASNIGSQPGNGGFGFGGSFSGSQNRPSNSGSSFGGSFSSNRVPAGEISKRPESESSRPVSNINSKPSSGGFGFGGSYSGVQNAPIKGSGSVPQRGSGYGVGIGPGFGGSHSGNTNDNFASSSVQHSNTPNSYSVNKETGTGCKTCSTGSTVEGTYGNSYHKITSGPGYVIGQVVVQNPRPCTSANCRTSAGNVAVGSFTGSGSNPNGGSGFGGSYSGGYSGSPIKGSSSISGGSGGFGGGSYAGGYAGSGSLGGVKGGANSFATAAAPVPGLTGLFKDIESLATGFAGAGASAGAGFGGAGAGAGFGGAGAGAGGGFGGYSGGGNSFASSSSFATANAGAYSSSHHY